MADEIKQWAIVELFGHKTIAGAVTKDTSVFPLLRIDVPATSQYPAFTAEYGPAAIYGIRYVSEAVAQQVAEAIKENPVTIYAPELITREKFDEAIAGYSKRLSEARQLASGIRDNETHADDYSLIKDDIEDDDLEDSEGF